MICTPRARTGASKRDMGRAESAATYDFKEFREWKPKDPETIR